MLHNKKVLVVKEHGKKSLWKFPGGLVDLGEDLETAVEREVYEETRVKSKFESILTVRHQHGSQFGRSDLYFLCLLHATSEEITIDDEIQDAKWVSPEELRNQTPFPTVLYPLDLLINNHADKGFTGKLFPPFYKNRMPYRLYFPNAIRDENIAYKPLNENYEPK